MSIVSVMQGKCLFSDISRPAPMSQMRRRYSARSLQKSNAQSVLRIILDFTSVSFIFTQAACDTEGTSMFVQLGPEHEINLPGGPYELVPE